MGFRWAGRMPSGGTTIGQSPKTTGSEATAPIAIVKTVHRDSLNQLDWNIRRTYAGLESENLLGFFSIRAADQVDGADAVDPVFEENVLKDEAVEPLVRKHLRGTIEKLLDRKSTRLNSSHTVISYAVF